MRNKSVLARSATAAVLCGFLCVAEAKAEVIITLEQVGSDVVATATGTIDTAGATYFATGDQPPLVEPSLAAILVGDSSTSYDGYRVALSGPASFGSGSLTDASSGTGDRFGLEGSQNFFVVDQGYISGDPISGTATWDNTTLSLLGVTPGVYTWSFGDGATADSISLYAGVPGPAVTPEPTSLALLGTGLAGLCGVVRRKINRKS